MGQGPSVDELLAIARAEFAGRLPAKVAELEQLSAREAWQDLRVASHKLRGSAATYGFARLGATAATVEEVLIAAACQPDAVARDRVRGALIEARAEASRAARAATEAR
jgi:HPt (histidine-containing phosphotransfer) domain-containing protein